MRLGFGRRLATSARALVADDAVACSKIHLDSFHQGWNKTEFENLIVDSNVLGDGWFDPAKGRMLGFAMSRLVAGEAEILTIAVDKSVRGNRIGSGLLADHIAALKLAGSRKLFLEVAEDNIAALKLYRSFDFHNVGCRPGYYQRQGPAAVNAQVLALDL